MCDRNGTVDTMSGDRTVTHRLVRHVHRVENGSIMRMGQEPLPFTSDYWEASCACSRVFRADTDTACSGKYLDHLPPPVVAV